MTYFQVTAEHLKIAQGNVRCGHCRNVFSALGNLTERLPDPNATDGNRNADSDFLTDEELGEFEDFDTNIYDDEDSIFNAFIDDDEEQSPDQTPAINEPRADNSKAARRPDTSAKPTTKPPVAPGKQSPPPSKPAPSAQSRPTQTEPTAPAAKKLASLREGQKAYLEKLKQAMAAQQQQELEQQTRIFNAAAAVDNAPASTARNPATKTSAQPQAKTKAAPDSAAPKPPPAQSGTTPAKSAPAQKPAARNTAATAAKVFDTPRPNAKTPAADSAATDKTPARKPDIPLQRSGEDLDFDSALQALDELEINDEHADFVASVIKEFEATNIAPALQSQTPDSSDLLETPSATADVNAATARSAKDVAKVVADERSPLKTPPAPIAKKKSSLSKLNWKKRKPGKKPRPKTRKKAAQPAPQPVIEGSIPTLPAILRESYQDEAARHRMTPAAIAWSVGSMLLMLFFLAQTVYFKHDQLAHVSTLRPWIVSFCRHFNCEVSLQYDQRELELLGQDIRSDPKLKDALMVSTTIINKAGFRQAYPGLQITFTDMNGQRVAMRRFLPEEYLPRGTNIKRGMPPDTPIQVELKLMDPGSDAINFEFEFFKPI